MKKYILGISVLVFSFILITPSPALASCPSFITGQGHIREKTTVCGIGADTGQLYWFTCQADGSYKRSNVGTMGCYKGQVRGWDTVPRPVPLNVEVMSPAPQVPHKYTFGQYQFVPYPFTQLNISQPLLPATDPITVQHKDPCGGNCSIFPEIDISSIYNSIYNPVESTVVASAGPASSFGGPSNIAAGVSWPPLGVFTNFSYWNRPLAYTFKVYKAFTSPIYNPNPGNAIALPLLPDSKFYPLNFFTVADPTAKIPLLPTVPININWASVPGALKYKFTLGVADNPFNLTGLNSPIDIQITNPRTYNFSGKPSVSYSWSVTPLVVVNGADTPLLGDPIIKDSVGIFFTANINGPSPSQPYSFTYDHYEYGWDKIPGAVRYEIQYALSFHPIPDSTPFADNAAFTENTITTNGTPGGPITETTHILSSTINGTPGLNYNDDLGWLNNIFHYDYFHYDFLHSVLAGINSNILHQGLHWRVRGIDANGNFILKNLVQSGDVEVPLPKTPYQSAYLSWPLDIGATSYLVDIVTNPADFAKLPYLTQSEVPPLTQAQTQAVKINAQPVTTTPTTGNFFTSFINKAKQLFGAPTPQPAGTTPDAPDPNKVFLIRRVVPDSRSTIVYNSVYNGTVTVDKFQKLIREARVYAGKVNFSFGNYDADPNTGISLFDEQQFDDQAKTSTNNFTTFSQAQLDGYYPLMTSDLGMITSYIAPNQLKLVTTTPITITNKSTGNAKLVVAQSNGKKTTILTFTTQAGSSGEYAFDITKNINGSSVIHPLIYPTIGPMSVIPDLTGKDYAEFDKLLPGQTYYWRQRCMKDPQIFDSSNPTKASAPFTFCPWSQINSFTTPTGLPASIEFGSLTDFQGLSISEASISPANLVPINPINRTTKVKLQLAPGTSVQIKANGETKSYTVAADGTVTLIVPNGEQKIEVMTSGYKSLELTIPAQNPASEVPINTQSSGQKQGVLAGLWTSFINLLKSILSSLSGGRL